MYVIVWEYEAAPGREAEFEKAYSSEGIWVQFFLRAEGYRGTEFLRHSTTERCYLTIDRWDSAAQYQTFRQKHAGEYQAIDEACEELTVSERHIGSYQTD